MFKKIILFFIVFIVPQFLFAMEATYYSDIFEGATTANGDTFSQENYTAALCAENLGQLVYVSRGNTGVTVLANDRPNCIRYPNIVDLTSTAFSRFSPLDSGRIDGVSVEPLEVYTENFIKRDYSQQVFSDLGIELGAKLSNTYFAGESIALKGEAIGGSGYVMTYIENKKTGEKETQSYSTDKNGKFQIVFSLPKNPGEYYFVVAAGTSFRTKTPLSLLLIDQSTFQPSTVTMTTLPSRMTLRPVTLGEDTVFSLPKGVWGTLSIKTASGVVDTFGQALTFGENVLTKGKATYVFTGYTLSTPSSLDRSPLPTYVSSGTVLLDTFRAAVDAKKVRVWKQANTTSFYFRLPVGQKIPPIYYVTLPNGDVRVYEFLSQYIDTTSGFLRTGMLIRASFPSNEMGSYKLEVNDAHGFAYFNVPVIRGNIWNIVQPLSNADIRDISVSENLVKQETLSSINHLRLGLGRGLVGIDPALSLLAQKKAEDMARYDYVGHVSQDGKTLREFGASVGINIADSMGENVAGGNVSGKALQLGLEESGSHRENMIDPHWVKVGIGFVISGDKTYMVQVFSE